MTNEPGLHPTGVGWRAMTLERRIAAAFRMDDAAWARHANPWSGWTRFPILSLLVLAIWSRVWIGWWSLVPIGVVLAWTWLNPRVFPAPRSTESWMSQAVFGERAWLDRDRVPVPAHHRLVPSLLNLGAASGLPPLAWGLARLEAWPTILGLALVLAFKLWYLDRMVWLYREMAVTTPEYRAWSAPSVEGH